MHRFSFKVLQAKSGSLAPAFGNWESEILTVIIKASSPLNWSAELQKKRKLVKTREIVKKTVAKRSSSNS